MASELHSTAVASMLRYARVHPADTNIRPESSAEYTADILKGLILLARSQKQTMLAHLLEVAQFEARWQATNNH